MWWWSDLGCIRNVKNSMPMSSKILGFVIAVARQTGVALPRGAAGPNRVGANYFFPTETSSLFPSLIPVPPSWTIHQPRGRIRGTCSSVPRNATPTCQVPTYTHTQPCCILLPCCSSILRCGGQHHHRRAFPFGSPASWRRDWTSTRSQTLSSALLCTGL